jgi:hypothetical protein
MKLFRSLVFMLAVTGFVGAAYAQENPSRFAGTVRAVNFAYGYLNTPSLQVDEQTLSPTGTATLSVAYGTVTLGDGTVITPLSITAPLIIGTGANQETVTPTAVNCTTPQIYQSCNFTASFLYQHGTGDKIASGTFGLQDAINYAFSKGGGQVAVDFGYTALGGTDTIINAAIPFSSVTIQDNRRGVVQYWNSLPSTTTLLAAPTVLAGQVACDSTHQFCSDATVAGSGSWAGTVYGCYTLVDINGKESPCSATASYTSVVSKAIDMGVSFTARTDNVVGWKPYLSVSGGSYVLAYSVPLLTQPTTLLAVPVSSGVCTLTALETTTPACAIANSTYGQSGSTTGVTTLFKGGAQFTGYPVVTNTLAPMIGSVSALQHNPNEDAHATYGYVSGARVGTPGIQSDDFIFPITAAAQTTIGEVEGTFPIPAQTMNMVGKTLEVCGTIVKTSTTADTVDLIQVWWDAEGSNVSAGTPVKVASINITPSAALAAAANFDFCQQITTTVASTTATGGTLTPGHGWATVAQAAAGANSAVGPTSLVAAVGSLNLSLPAHVSVELVHTTGTDGAGSTLQGATVRVIN